MWTDVYKNNDAVTPNRLVVFEPSRINNSTLICSSLDSLHLNDQFFPQWRSYLSSTGLVNEMFLLDSLLEDLVSSGFTPVFFSECIPAILEHLEFKKKLVVDGLLLPDGFELFPYQSYGLRKAIKMADSTNMEAPLFFFNFGTGTGKSIISAAGAQELFNQGKIDLCVAFTLSKLKINLMRTFNQHTSLNAVNVEGQKKQRQKKYKGDFDVLVTNYERCHFDFEELSELVSGKRVLWIMDECQKVIHSDQKATNARKAMDKLIKKADSICWPMSATVVNDSPLNFRDTFSLNGRPRKNILGTKKDFEDEFLESKFEKSFITRKGFRFSTTTYSWDNDKLETIPERVSDYTMSVRKRDKPVASMFKDIDVIVTPIQMSSEDRFIYRKVEAEAERIKNASGSISVCLKNLRYICNTPEVLQFSNDDLSIELCRDYPKSITSKYSSKLEVFLDQVEAIGRSKEKVIAFTKFTKLTLFTLHKYLKKRGIKHVIHYGAGQSQLESQKAQDEFKNNDDVVLFLTSDAGAHGLNFQEARYVIHYDVPYSYDLLVQRNDRINRADSYLDGQTSYLYITEDSIEERIWEENKRRKRLAEKTQGVKEYLKVDNDVDLEDSFLAGIPFEELISHYGASL